ncbi:hypothetical protein GO495_30260 [Chitinophaga oryziterrae]|uniref:Uncharacterized protein n=1 Tax=Chitinophaga oryziterrae TaxID=1031224 RepID=A0A6N8JIW7_9BACT|nr:hypothetical protein [Chitinophaga oryziterrae]MVT44914.1 hypothetical protein [Chitinophaga oryziterrae]
MTAKLYSALTILTFIICSCNKNTDQLPPPDAPPAELVLSARLNGLAVVDFIFHQTRTQSHDTVWLSLRNTSGAAIPRMKYLVELCNAVPQSYTTCNLQLVDTLRNTLQPDATLEKVYTWIDKNINLDSMLINTGIISCTGVAPHPVAGVYQSTYAVFETEGNNTAYYGSVRAYIFADGATTFRLQGQNEDSYNATGQFIQVLAFDGLLKKGKDILSPFHLDTVADNQLLDTSNGKLILRLHLTTPISDTIHSLLFITQRI